MKIGSRPVELWQAIPCKTMLALIASCLVIGESYPFSSFPMFGSFSGKTYYVFLADQAGRPVPTMDFGVPANGIKKAYDAALQRARKSLPKKGKVSLAQDRLAAEDTLRYLLKRRPAATSMTALRLVRVDLRMEQGQLKKETRTAGELSLR